MRCGAGPFSRLFSATLSVATGCSGQSGFLTGGPTVGQMKTSLSHLEFENVELKRSVAKLQQENRSMEDRLVQEQIDNGDLTARLDDARNLLRDRGIESDVRVRISAPWWQRHRFVAGRRRRLRSDRAGKPGGTPAP